MFILFTHNNIGLFLISHFRVNILSLCDVLSRIIEERRSQSNFMLIVITHDEEFVSNLGYIERLEVTLHFFL